MADGDYMPTTEQVRAEWPGRPESFDRWLAAHDNEIRADALDAATEKAPWDRADGCFGHCDPEGWFVSCRAPEPHDYD